MPARKPEPEKTPEVASVRPDKFAKKSQQEYRQDAIAAANAAIAKKAIEPVLIDLSGVQSYTDYLLVTSAHGSRGVRAIGEHVEKVLAERGVYPIGSEGVAEGHWALIDFGDLVVHVFDQNLREFYDLEGMWFDAPRIELAIPPDQRLEAQAFRYGSDLLGEGPEGADQDAARTVEHRGSSFGVLD
ncbi:ribosome silencing factor [Haliangium sp. UPWRP_2]|uniref:ribosome silencing factor n=1 Tax=Haliangium sp. UPWRP_2 TaxID=1931276 RepID=UPI001304F9C7|nr:ribosome silencing factor [Haliangium sp. UPWRP_2]